MTSQSLDASSPVQGAAGQAKGRFLALMLGSIGVVYGDIGTSPLYAFKESIAHVGADGTPATQAEIFGVVSLMFWALMIIVTMKYALLLMRLGNRGEGGTLSLAALAQRLAGRRTAFVLVAGMLGAAMFYGDAMLTPAISVLSAVEGLTVIPALSGHIEPFILPIALCILAGLFLMQSHGTHRVGALFGPICLLWFTTLAGLGLYHLAEAPEVLQALNPAHALGFLFTHHVMSFVVLGSVFLTVTGAEALYADMGHFGRKPIASAWIWIVLPCLTLNYLGQAAMVLRHPENAASPFFLMAPEAFRPALVVLATMATIIASQAVISGAYSLTRQAIQLGLLPRLHITQTSETEFGQIYMPQVNYMLLAGVVFLTVAFGSSSAMAHAYGMSVIGAMLTSSILAVAVIPRAWNWKPIYAMLLMAPFIAIELVFLSANALKIFSGGIVPLLIAGGLMFLMTAWVRGAKKVADYSRTYLSLTDLYQSLARRPPALVKGTAIFLTSEPDYAPAALLHNLKHNHVLHERLLILTVRTAPTPEVPDSAKVEIKELQTPPGLPRTKIMTLNFGFMETPNVSKALALARKQGMAFDIMDTTFFVSRTALIAKRAKGLPRVLSHVYIATARNATDAFQFFQIPSSRVVELGNQAPI